MAARTPQLNHTRKERNVALQQEIEQFVSENAISEAELDLRQWILTKVREIASKQLGPSANTVCFGSSFTGLLLPSSDLDVVVLYDENANEDSSDSEPLYDDTARNPTREKNIRILKRIQEALHLSTFAERDSIRLVSQSTVPVLKWTEKITKISIDLSVNNEAGKKSSEKIKEWMGHYPALKPMALLLKHYLWRAGLNDNFTGGMGSYLLVNLLVFLFKRQPTLTNHPTPYSNILLSFLTFYGKMFNYREYGISAKTGKSFLLSEDTRKWHLPRRTDMVPLVVEDPTDPLRDIARSAYNIAVVFKMFSDDVENLKWFLSPGNPIELPGILQMFWNSMSLAWNANDPRISGEEMDIALRAKAELINTIWICMGGCVSFAQMHREARGQDKGRRIVEKDDTADSFADDEDER